MSTAILRPSPPIKAALRSSLATKTLLHSQNAPHRLSFPTKPIPKTLDLTLGQRHRLSPASAVSSGDPSSFTGPCYVVGDHIDTDQIIPAEYLTLVPSKPDEYKKLGSYAFVGLPSASYPVRFVEDGQDSTKYRVIIAGANFGCGSSREHAPVALGAAGATVVVAESYARIFFRNSVATGEIYPIECEGSGIWKECKTGDVVSVDIDGCRLVNQSTGKEYKLKPIGDAGPVIEAGGIFAYARKTGMIAAAST